MAHLNQVNETLSQRTVELGAIGRQLKHEIVRRKAAEEALAKSEQHYGLLLEQSRQMQEHLRHLSHQVLSAQEEERKQISRELHDEIAQTLTGINISLATLTKEATINTNSLKKKIASTQQLVEKSMRIVHRFARELRPMLLDELGLIPALHSYMKNFTERTGIHIRFTVFAEIEQLDSVKRTVLYRVAQEALTNVARHAQASLVKVSIRKLEWHHSHGNNRQRQILPRATRVVRQKEQTLGTALHARAVGDGQWQLHRRICTGQRHHHPSTDSV